MRHGQKQWPNDDDDVQYLQLGIDESMTNALTDNGILASTYPNTMKYSDDEMMLN